MNKQEAQALLRNKIVLDDVKDHLSCDYDLPHNLGFSKGEYGSIYNIGVEDFQGESHHVFRFPGGYLVAYQFYGSCELCSGTLTDCFRINAGLPGRNEDDLTEEELIPIWRDLMNDQIGEMEWFPTAQDVLDFIKGLFARQRHEEEEVPYKEEDMAALEKWLYHQ